MMSRLVYQLQTLRQDHLGNDSGPLCGPWGVPRSICVCMCRNTSHIIFPEVDLAIDNVQNIDGYNTEK